MAIEATSKGSNGHSHEPINTQPRVSFDILITGAGVAGLLLALECKRLGLSPTIIERKDKIEPAGDFVVVGDSPTKVFKHWPQLNERYLRQAYRIEGAYYKHDGTPLVTGYLVKDSIGRPIVRRNLMEMLKEAVERQGIPIHYNKRVMSYFDEGEKGGVVLEGGERMTADVVAACDGVHSRSSLLITGKRHEVVSSESAVYRTSVNAEYIFEKDPSLRERFELHDGRPYLNWLIGPGNHGLVFSDGETICWSVHHPENKNTSTESWTATLDGKMVYEQMLQDLPDWDPQFLSLVKNTPDGTVNDWLLLFRDPEPKWVSSGGRVTQAGDSAHPFLPTSANGASQAMEDSVTLATTLRMGIDRGASVKESLTVYNILRYERTSAAQLMGFLTRQIQHETDWEAVAKDVDILRNAGPGNWLSQHDPEAYAQEKFDECLQAQRSGEKFVNTNIPPGHTHTKWTCEEILEKQRKKEHLKVDGNWS